MKLFNLKKTWLVALLVITQIYGCGGHKDEDEKHDLLTKQEVSLINKYVSSASVQDAIGQLLMVGVPADLNTAEDSANKSLDEIITKRGIGMVIVNGFNYYDNKSTDENEYLTRIIHFNNHLQSKTSKSINKIPLLIATDFEGSSISSIKRGLVLPPSALSLSTTQDGPLIKTIGNYVGKELTNIGIQIILGPVLDTYNVKQGTKNILQDRCFAGIPEGVARTASHYISGLHESGIVVFAKHYPSHGSIETDPHQTIIPVHQGSKEQLIDELKPFIQSKDNIQGIMTSHIKLVNYKDSGMATFSREVLADLNKYGLNKKIIITDDLSDMGAIRNYMIDHSKTYQNIAIDAFDAGHDILLFAHISDEKKPVLKTNKGYIKPNFTLNDLRLVQEQLTKHITSSDASTKKFRESLKKILILKAQVARMKSPQEPLDRLFGKIIGSDTAYKFQVNTEGRGAIENTENNILTISKKFNSPSIANISTEGNFGNNLVKESIRRSVIAINKQSAVNINILEQKNEAKIIFAVYEDQIEQFKTAFSSHFVNALFLKIPKRKDTGAFTILENDLLANYRKAKLLVYTARDGDDAALLTRLKNNNKSSYSNKTIIFLHNSPAIFDNELISDSTIIGNFSMHPFSFAVDIEILSGSIAPKPLRNIPINIGDNAKFYNVSSTKWVEPSNQTSFGELFSQDSIQECKYNLAPQYYLIPKIDNSELWRSIIKMAFLLTLVISICLATYLIPKKCISEGWKTGSSSVDTIFNLMGSPQTGKLIAFILCMLLLFFIFDYDYANNILERLITMYERTHATK